MKLIRLGLKALVLPLILVVTLAQWLGIFLVSFSMVAFNAIAALVFMVAIASLLMGLIPANQAVCELGVSFAVFIVPHLAMWLIARITAVNCTLREFLMS